MIEFDAAQYEHDKDNREFLDKLMEAVISLSERVNEGYHGVIMRVDLSNPNTRELFAKVIRSIDDSDLAAKILKLYGPGMAEAEMALQAKAYRVVTAENGSNKNYAQVPKVYMDETINVNNPEALRRLESLNVEVGPDHQVEAIVMDYVDGIDFATYIDRLVIANHPELRHLISYLQPGERWDFDMMHRHVAQALKFEIPKVKANEPDQMYAEYKVFSSNRKKIIDFLKKAGVTIDPNILNRVNNTISLLHSKGIYHHDLHERNIMLSFSDRDMTQVKDVFIVDFGQASEMPVTSSVPGQKPNDTAVYSNYYTLHTTAEQDEKIIQAETARQRRTIAEAMRNRQPEKYDKILRNLKELLDGNNYNLALGWSDERTIDEFIAVWYEAVQNTKFPTSELISQLRKMKKLVEQKNAPPFVSNKLNEFIALLEKTV